LNYQKSEFAKELLAKIPKVEVKRSSPTFNEFTIVLPKRVDHVIKKMAAKGFIAGFPLGKYYKGMDNYLLVTVTEIKSKDNIVDFAKALEEVLVA
ncbi:MAG: glycine dehydrogenase, partial [Candidatus Omnitrophota bacterium]